MNFRLVVNPRAEQDAEEAALWYEKQHKGLGIEFIQAIDEGILSIQNNPHKFTVLRKDFRRVVLRRFPFGIFYKIDNDVIVVVAVWHFKRKPFSFLRREK